MRGVRCISPYPPARAAHAQRATILNPAGPCFGRTAGAAQLLRRRAHILACCARHRAHVSSPTRAPLT
eukprot:303532-Chlamydomonas_euryale.AAC.1